VVVMMLAVAALAAAAAAQADYHSRMPRDEIVHPEVGNRFEKREHPAEARIRASEFTQAVIDVVTGRAGTNELARLFGSGAPYLGPAKASRQLPAFPGNDDIGGIASAVRAALPEARPPERLRRELLAHAMLLTLAGVPGDEKGLAGKDSLDRKNSLAARANGGADDPLYNEIEELAHIRATHPALTRGSLQPRYASDKPGLLALSRFDPSSGREMLLLFNTSPEPLRRDVRVERRSKNFEVIAGGCPLSAQRAGSVEVELPAFGYSICHAR
jgi:hypothetical protein